ncbi:hypothetical protein [Ensifer adhaerens]|uniref:hypothetical protein n=1 Tax=Ensifer adhaerens TaxID=106592 RepID=UPI0014468123|nr:hypothetical protein [Ensifer adhaerens]MDF8358650.1 hypothetical protein [Ensifer adhaerens]
MKLGRPFRKRLLPAFLLSVSLGASLISTPALAQEAGELRIATSYMRVSQSTGQGFQ